MTGHRHRGTESANRLAGRTPSLRQLNRETEELINMCCSVKGEKTKTKFVLDALRADNYERRTHNAILNRDGLNSSVWNL